MDSTALLHIFSHFKKHFGFQFSVAHVHHGPGDKSQLSYRKKAWEFVKNSCAELEVPFYSNFKGDEESFLNSWVAPLKSESDFRDYRYEFFGQLKSEISYDWLVLAHHQQDLMETRMIRLIRGVGPEGIEAMSLERGDLLRPLLGVSPSELKAYLKFLGQKWLEDPSNENTQYFRNWLRKEWLPQLEEKRPGSLQTLSRSLDLLLENTKGQSVPLSCLQDDEIVLSDFLLLDSTEKSQALATYMNNQGLKNYGQSHIKELLKRLDSEK
ncbi:MAG: tRNA lysidine(34) synthetase TilS, partial [Bdellovibrionales bacterium]|nr:tRNA lysidine(34) synthetase TilS [Bdellovibrionales bacterium]